MKVPIEVEGMPEPNENDAAELNEEQVEAENEGLGPTLEETEAQVEPEFDEEAMVEAAKRAGEAAAEEDFRAEAERAREEVGDLLAKLAAAEEEVAATKKKLAEAGDRIGRLQIDWDNFRRRTEAERVAEKERAAEKLVVALLPVLDDMERASAHALANSGDDEQLVQFVAGVDAVHDKMVGILGHEGVTVINPVGEAFDPLVHQAVGRVEDKGAYDESVAQVYQRGYAMGGKVLRAAMVTVTFGGPKRPAPEPEA